MTVDRPILCPHAANWRQTTLKNLCGKRFVANHVEHGCGSRLDHQPRTAHVCVCGARHIEAVATKVTNDDR